MEDRLKSLVTLILRRCGSLPRTNLVKMLFLVDWEYVKATGSTYTGIQYRFYKFGPYASAVPQACARTPWIHLDTRPLSKRPGKEAYIYSLTADAPNWLVPEPICKIVDNLCVRTDPHSLDSLLALAYSTEPMAHARRGDVLMMSRSEKHLAASALETAQQAALRRLADPQFAKTMHPEDAKRREMEAWEMYPAQYEVIARN